MQMKFSDDTYPPSEDTFFVADYIEKKSGSSALDIGSGSGYLTQVLSKNFALVVGTDINYAALKNQTFKTENLVCCSGSDAIRAEFDLVVCNMPYLATDSILDVATDGGAEGFEVPKKILDSARSSIKKGGRMVFVTSSLSNYNRLIKYAESLGLHTRIISRKKLFFEELILIEAEN
ncbi:MAG: methyltransferase domain-containing protein [Nitrosopumilus sp. D6]|nr:MAG: methyltransferase domain-containing protein [Nitrosopumilus sp. D6]